MHDSSCYRNNAAKCLLAAHDAREPHNRKLLSIAVSWLSLARQDEAMDDPFANADTDVKTETYKGAGSTPIQKNADA